MVENTKISSNMVRRLRLNNQLKWLKSHGSKAYPVHQLRVDDGKKLQVLLHGLKAAPNPHEELVTNMLFASDNPLETVIFYFQQITLFKL
jgi:hypothetical protein